MVDQQSPSGVAASAAPTAAGAVPTSVRWALALGGAGSAVAGGIAVFATENGAGSAALVAAGGLAVLVSVFANRVTAFEGGGLKMQLDAVASTLEAARQADADGQPEVAASLRDDARLLMGLTRPLATRYEEVRRSQPSGWDRVAHLEGLVRQAADLARQESWTVSAVEALYDVGEEGSRVMALAMMAAVPSLATHRVTQEAVASPRSAFEQYHALRVAEALAVDRPHDPRTAAMAKVIRDELTRGAFGAERSDRANLAERVLSMIPGQG